MSLFEADTKIRDRALLDISAILGGTFSENNWGKVLDIVYENCNMQISFGTDSHAGYKEYAAYVTNCTTDWPQRDFTFKIFTSDFIAKIILFFDLNKIRTGNREFDRHFHIRSSKPLMIKNYLDQQTCNNILLLLDINKSVYIEIVGNVIRIRVNSFIVDNKKLLSLVNISKRIFDRFKY